MSKTAQEDDDRINPKLAASCFDFLLMELVPLAYRIAADLNEREQALVAQYATRDSIPVTTLPDRTSQISSSAEGAGSTAARPTSMGGVTGTDTTGIEDEETRESVFYKLDALGYRVGQGLVERFSADQARPTTQLDSIKFVCKDLWTRVFRKQIDNLKTNHRGTFVLTDNRFHPLHRMSVDRRLGPRGVEEALSKAQAFLWFPCGIIRGALSGLGMNVTVHAETTDLPIATFQIRSVGTKP